jgi:ankyrin repeat protein
MKPMAKLRRDGLLLIMAFLCCAAPARAQEQAPVEFPEKDIASHRIGLPRYIHTENVPRIPSAVTLKVIVTPFGNVESAQAVGGLKEFYAEAETIEMQRQFKPFENDGVPVRASIKDQVSIYPLEKWATGKTPFPEIKDWSSLRINFKRKSCQFEDKDCLSHSVEIRGDGSVTFTGGPGALISGVHHGNTSHSAIVNLVNEFRRADYFSLKNSYNGQMTDASTTITSIEFDGNKKQVVDYLGLFAGMPEVVFTIEAEINEAAGTGKWLKETDETWPSLLAEHWNFKAQTEENRHLFANVAAKGSNQLIQNFLAAGAPPLALTEDGVGALVSVAGRGNSDIVGQILADQDHLPAALLFRALRAAARSGNLATVDLLLSKGADVNGNSGNSDDADYLDTVLMAAARSGNADVIQEILKYHPDVKKKDSAGRTALEFFVGQNKNPSSIAEILRALVEAGADVNVHDDQGKTPIFNACHNVEALKPLVAVGADLNAKDRFGETPIMQCFVPKGLTALIEAGADLTAQNNHGQTAAQKMRQDGLIELANILEAAMKAKIQQ